MILMIKIRIKIPRLLDITLLAALCVTPVFSQTITGTDPVKIFILAGESNMHGKGTVAPVTTPGTLDYLYANDQTGRYQFLKSGGNYVTRADVGIRGLVPSGAPNPGNLTINYGGGALGLIGPELGFGHVIGDAFENKVLIVKIGVDGTTLAHSFCPPSSRPGEPEPVATGDKGYYYKEIINQINLAKAALGTTPYEIVGLGWHQGWNDRANAPFVPLYEVNMANFINDIRSADKGIGVSNLPVVIASAAMDWNYGYSEVERAQLKMADATAYPAFVGNVAVVDTRTPYDGLEFWQSSADSPANEGFHWNRSGKSFLHIGMAMGDAMSQMVPTRIPFRIRASGGSNGVTLTWKNGTELPTSVRVLRNGVEIAAAASANPPAFLDTTAPLGVNTYELQFTMPVSACPPLSINHNSGITNLKGNQRANGVRLTWENNLGYAGITVKRNGSIIAASLPGNSTSYTDVSPLTGAVTYSVEPTDVGATPVSVQVNVSAASANGALIYEPFEMTAGTTLAGKEGGIGLDGKWDGDSNIQVTSNAPYVFGSLPVAGNRIIRVTGNGSCAIAIGNTLQEAGLMEHGAQLWFSFLSQNTNDGNHHPTLALGDDILSSHNLVSQGGNAIGAKLSSAKNVVGIIHKNGAEAAVTATQQVLTSSEVVLVVGRIIWGADDSAPDIIEIYTPGTDLVLDTPASVSAIVDQSKFKVLSMWGNGSSPNMDEIRFGASYQSVIGTGITSGYWDLNGSAIGAGGTDGDKPIGIWNGDSNWNSDYTGSGSVAPFASGGKAVFSAGGNATGAFTVTVDGTKDIGGMVFEEGAPTLSGGTALRMTGDTSIDVKSGLTVTIQTPLTEDISRSLSKEGSGTLVLTGNNSYTGYTYLFSGILQANTPASLPGYTTSNKIIINGGTLGLAVGSGWSTAQVNSLLSAAAKFDGAIGIDAGAGNLVQWTAFTNSASSFGTSLGLTKLGANTLTLDQANTYAGITRVRQGTLALAHNLALQNSALATAANGSITISGMNSPTFGGILDDVDLSDALGTGYANVSSLTLNPGSARSVTYDGVIADGAPGMQLVKTGAGTQILNGANTFTGLTTIRAGTLAIGGDSGTLTESSGIHLDGGTLHLDSIDTDLQATINRIGDDTPFTSQGGSLTYRALSSTSSRQFSETIAEADLLGGQTNFALTINKISGGQTLTLSSLNRPGFANSTATFSAIGSAPNSTRNKIKIIGAAETPAGGILGAWATTGTAPTAQTDYARIDASGNVIPLNASATTEAAWSSSSSNYMFNNAANTLTVNRTVNTLRYYGGNPSTPSLYLENFNLELNGFLCSGTGGGVVFTITSASGVIRQPGTAPAKLYLTASGRSLTITAPIQNNTGALTLVKSGNNIVLLNGAAGTIAYSGDTVVNGGDLQVNSTNTNNDASAVFIAPGARMILNFSGTDTVQRLYINGSRVHNGVYGRSTVDSNALGIGAYFGTSGNGTLTVSDAVAPTLAAADIVDDKNGSSVAFNTLVNYTLTFSEEMNPSTITAADFGNAGSAAVSIGTVRQISPNVFLVPVTPTTTGTLQLRINNGADVRDFVNIALNTNSAIADNTILTVNDGTVPYDTWAGPGIQFGADTNNDGVPNGVAFLLGADNPDDNAAVLLPQPAYVSGEEGGLKLTFRIRNAASRGSARATLNWSQDLGISDPWVNNFAEVPDSSQTVNGVVFQVLPNGDLNDITATIPPTEGLTGKLFGRLTVTSN